jgi:hypothetical protein
MARKVAFDLIFDPEVKQHLRAIEAKHHSLIRETIHEQLTFSPETETRNRKPLQRPADFGATWELRFARTTAFGCSTRSTRKIARCKSWPSA